MIVIASKTELKLRDDLRNLARTKPNQRCFYLAFSKTDIARETLFETFLRILEDIPNSYMARVYLCQDRDIVIVMEGFMQRHFENFVAKLGADLKTDNLGALSDIYEIGLHWQQIEALYTAKINAIQNAEALKQEQYRKKRAEENTLHTLQNLDAKRIETIETRRINRARPLVMIADDDQLSRTLAGNVLRADYDMAFAKNGTEALQEYVASAPDILFLDIGMPDIGGHEVLEALFQIDPDAYIIMFSGRKDKTTIMKSLTMGAQGFLGKPFTREQLYSHVGNSPFVQNKRHQVA
ncbi:MAG: hypothetical protein CMH27_02705 [Micavibrio sp.]|nr:hypothetical protein [Micavibrio sp.]|tara:strand:- start:3682 stop:4566 length:885 start_codon:yes stop_codon:yes gene_type:complete